MILSFRCKDTEKLFAGYRIRKWVAIEREACRKLVQLELAMRLKDMDVPPQNRLTRLSDHPDGPWKVMIKNSHYLRFRWVNAGAEDVEIVEESKLES